MICDPLTKVALAGAPDLTVGASLTLLMLKVTGFSEELPAASVATTVKV